MLERVRQHLQAAKEGLPIVMDVNVGGLRGCKRHQDAIKAFSKGEAGAGIRGIENHWSINKLSQRGKAFTASCRSPEFMTLLPPGLSNRLAHVATAKNGALFTRRQDGALPLGQHLVERGKIWRGGHGNVTFHEL